MASQNVAPFAVCFDIESWGSKISWATYRPGKGPKAGRIPRPADIGDSESTSSSLDSNHVHEFPASAALEDDPVEGRRLVPGKRARDRDRTFSIKSLMCWASGIRHPRKLKDMPGVDDIALRWSAGVLTGPMVRECARKHIEKLHDEAQRLLKEKDVVLSTVVVTYPNWLCTQESDGDFNKYLDFLTGIIRGLYPASIDIMPINEGQALVTAVCQRWKDIQSTHRGSDMWKHFEALDSSYFLLGLFDFGGSSCNAQTQLMKVEQGEIVKSQSIRAPSSKPGAPGGSFSFNCLIQSHLHSRLPNENSVIAEYLADFERQKYDLDPGKLADDSQGIFLTSKSGKTRHLIHFEQLDDGWKKAFAAGIKVLRSEIDELLNLKYNFGMVFGGGSCKNPGLRRVINAEMEKARVEAASNGMLVRWAFLHNFDNYCSSTVSLGGALCAVKPLPTPARSLSEAAIGIQRRMRKRGKHQPLWDTYASAMVCAGAGRLDCLEFNNNGDVKTFRLVCDPVYRRRNPDLDPTAGLPDINITDLAAPSVLSTYGMGTYDLGWEVTTDGLPPGWVRLEIGGQDVSAMVAGREPPIGKGGNFTLWLTCYSIDAGTREKRYDPKSRRWEVVLATDPPTKYAIVQKSPDVPVWCEYCGQEMKTGGHRLKTKEGMCFACFQETKEAVGEAPDASWFVVGQWMH